jgi:hypothetical protein
VLVTQAVGTASGPSDVAVTDSASVAGGADTTDGTDGTSEDGPPGGPSEPLLMSLVHAELQPDGTVRPLPLAQPGDVPIGDAVHLPDGRLATLASRDLRRGEPRTDGAMVEDVAFMLAVFDRDEQLVAEQDVRRRGERVAIAGAYDGRVVLVRETADGNCCGSLPGVRVSTIDPDTFEETRVAEVDRLPGVAAVTGDRLVLVDDGMTDTLDTTEARVPECRVTVVDLVTGESRPLTTLPCLSARHVSVSPTGERAALVIQRRAGITASSGQDILDQAVVFVSLADGEVLDSERFDIAPPCPSGGPECALRGPVEYRGLAWVDEDHVELVVQRPDPDPNPRMLDVGLLVPERLRTIPVEIGAG